MTNKTTTPGRDSADRILTGWAIEQGVRGTIPELWEAALRAGGGTKAGLSRLIGVSHKTITRRLRKYGIDVCRPGKPSVDGHLNAKARQMGFSDLHDYFTKNCALPMSTMCEQLETTSPTLKKRLVTWEAEAVTSAPTRSQS